MEAASSLNDDTVVIKAQILAGGRGLGVFTSGLEGGVHIIPKQEVAEYAGRMLGGTLITKQSGPAGKPVNTVLVAKKMDLVKEFYFSILLDRASGGPVMIGESVVRSFVFVDCIVDSILVATLWSVHCIYILQLFLNCCCTDELLHAFVPSFFGTC